MKVLTLAMTTQRYDLAAHVLVFATLRVRQNGLKNQQEQVNEKTEARSPKGKSERP